MDIFKMSKMRIFKKVFPDFHLFCKCDWNGKKVEKRGKNL
jgi:hypothetical protein